MSIDTRNHRWTATVIRKDDHAQLRVVTPKHRVMAFDLDDDAVRDLATSALDACPFVKETLR